MFEKKLEKLLNDADSARSVAIKNGSASYYHDDFYELESFICSNLESKFFKNRKVEIVVNNFDKILPFIVQNNIDLILLYINFFIEKPTFKQKFIEGLKNYPYEDGIEQIFANIYSGLNEENQIDKFDAFMDEDIFNTLVKLNLSSIFYSEILNKLPEEKQRIFLNILVDNKCNIAYNAIKYKGNNKQIIYDNLPLFLENSQNLYSLMMFAKDNEVALKKIKEYIDANEEKAIKSLFQEIEYGIEVNSPVIKEIIKLIVLDIMKNENAKFSDITFNGGGFSRVLLIGDKVLKIGNRVTKTFPNNPYIIAPLLRRELKSDNETVFVEVTERVDTSRPATNEEKYQLYKNLRNSGLIWTDINGYNVGRLTKNNIIHWRSSLNPSDKVLNLQDKRDSDIVLKEGDLVLLDADFIYDENDNYINFSNRKDIVKEFEERYQKEKKLDINIEDCDKDYLEYDATFKVGIHR